MNAKERREEISKILSKKEEPVSASDLAEKFSVSRQIIVGDIAILRASGIDICATPRGYIILKENTGLVSRIACKHDTATMEKELDIIVDNGCSVIDVIVEHPIYGQLTGQLRLSNRFEVSQFINRCEKSKARPLSNLTEGIHLHTLSCPSGEALSRVKTALKAAEILITE